MIFTNIKIFNMFGIDDAEIELTYPRKTPSSPVKQYFINNPKINYKKINVIIGANASGKTSIGKTMCFIQNFLNGRTIDLEKSFFKNAVYFPDKNYGFDIEFIINNKMYQANVLFKDNTLIKEQWKIIDIFQSDSITTLRSKIGEVDDFESYNVYDLENDKEEEEEYYFDLKSSFLSSTKHSKIANEIKLNQIFSYRYSKENHGNELKNIDLDFFTKVIRAFDPSIRSIRNGKDFENELVIEFVNGKSERISPDGKVSDHSILSAGTREAIDLVGVLHNIKNNKRGIYFIDEQLAFSHSDLERAIIELVLQWIDEKDMQVFFTTHNREILDVGLPVYNYMFTRKYNENSTIEIIQPEFEVAHKDRTLIGFVNDDVFSVSPSLESLIEVID